MQKTVTVGIISMGWFVIVMIALHLLRPDHNPIRQTTSQYVIGPYGYLMSSGFLAVSIASMTLVLALRKRLIEYPAGRIGLRFLSLWAVLVLIAMIFPINLEGLPLTTSAIIHRVNGPIAFASMVSGAVFLSSSFRNDEEFFSIVRLAQVLSYLMVVFFVITVVDVATQSGFAGLSQRAVLGLFVVWFFLVATRLSKTDKRDAA